MIMRPMAKHTGAPVCPALNCSICTSVCLLWAVGITGMIMWPKAKRSVSDTTAAEIAAAARTHGAQPVGVFVDEDAATITARCRSAGLGIAQLHGQPARDALAGIPPELQVGVLGCEGQARGAGCATGCLAGWACEGGEQGGAAASLLRMHWYAQWCHRPATAPAVSAPSCSLSSHGYLQVVYVVHAADDGSITTPLPEPLPQRPVDWLLVDGQQVGVRLGGAESALRDQAAVA